MRSRQNHILIDWFRESERGGKDRKTDRHSNKAVGLEYWRERNI